MSIDLLTNGTLLKAENGFRRVSELPVRVHAPGYRQPDQLNLGARCAVGGSGDHPHDLRGQKRGHRKFSRPNNGCN